MQFREMQLYCDQNAYLGENYVVSSLEGQKEKNIILTHRGVLQWIASSKGCIFPF